MEVKSSLSKRAPFDGISQQPEEDDVKQAEFEDSDEEDMSRYYYAPPREEKFPWKTAGMAVLLFAVGFVFTIWGAMTLQVERKRGIAMLVIGSLTFIPGSYASFQLYGAFKRWPGYRYAYVPSYDD